MPTEQQTEIMSTYVNLMSEAKGRISWIEYIVNGKSGLDPVIARESCDLQLRLICETIALCCLVAHGEIEETKAPKLQKLWSAPDILKGLEALHPSFFPVPRKPQKTGPHSWHFAEIEGDYLTKDKLIELYGACGNRLHRGSLKNIVTGKQPLANEMTEVIAAHAAISALLNVHHISLIGDAQFLCMMDDGHGHVTAHLAVPT